MKIAIVVHGRFHAFDLARELINQGHEVALLTNYPKFVAGQFGVPAKYVKSFILHGILVRVLEKLNRITRKHSFESFIHILFSRWAAKTLINNEYDIVYVFSGVAEEVFKALKDKTAIKTLVRGSSHIQTQYDLLNEEDNRSGSFIEKPSTWRIERERREYELSDLVVVLSIFAYKSFINHGFPKEKLRIMLLGNQVEKFRPDEIVINERCKRIVSGKPLRILMVGTFSLRKGAIDFIEIASLLRSRFEIRFVGSIADDAKHLISKSNLPIEFVPRQTHFDLPSYYSWGDVFIFTTIQDGYAVVLAQASASGMPIIATTNSSAPDIITEGINGWILPIRSPDSFVERLNWCNEHRKELSEMVYRIYNDFKVRDWSEVALDFAEIHGKF